MHHRVTQQHRVENVASMLHNVKDFEFYKHYTLRYLILLSGRMLPVDDTHHAQATGGPIARPR